MKQTLLAIARSIKSDLKGGNQYTRSILALNSDGQLETIYDHGTMGQWDRVRNDYSYVFAFDYLHHRNMTAAWLKDILAQIKDDCQSNMDTIDNEEYQYNQSMVINAIDNIQ